MPAFPSRRTFGDLGSVPGRVVTSAISLDIVLGYATTIHKAVGQELPAVIVDLKHLAGSRYGEAVALEGISRATSLSSLKVLNFTAGVVKPNLWGLAAMQALDVAAKQHPDRCVSAAPQGAFPPSASASSPARPNSHAPAQPSIRTASHAPSSATSKGLHIDASPSSSPTVHPAGRASAASAEREERLHTASLLAGLAGRRVQLQRVGGVAKGEELVAALEQSTAQLQALADSAAKPLHSLTPSEFRRAVFAVARHVDSALEDGSRDDGSGAFFAPSREAQATLLAAATVVHQYVASERFLGQAHTDESTRTSGFSQLMGAAERLHDRIFDFPDEAEHYAPLQETIVEMCEAVWRSSCPGCTGVVPLTLSYLLLRILEQGAAAADCVVRLAACKEMIGTLPDQDRCCYTSTWMETLAEVAVLPVLTSSSHGWQLLTYAFTRSVALASLLDIAIKKELMSPAPDGVVDTHFAWCFAGSEIDQRRTIGYAMVYLEALLRTRLRSRCEKEPSLRLTPQRWQDEEVSDWKALSTKLEECLLDLACDRSLALALLGPPEAADLSMADQVFR